MAKYDLRIQAVKMRRQGESVNVIARKLGVSKSTASLWVRDIILSVSDLEKLRQNSIEGAELGRLRGALKQKKARLELVEKSKQWGFKQIGRLSKREFFMAGLALYWAEGSKKERRVQVCNSDADLIKLMIKWLEEYFGVFTNRLTVHVGINEMHKDREGVVKNYWSKATGIPLDQFTKTSFKRVKSKKVYENFREHYGTLDIRVLKPAGIYYKIMGLIWGLSQARFGRLPA